MAEIFYWMDTRLGAAGVNDHLTTQQKRHRSNRCILRQSYWLDGRHKRCRSERSHGLADRGGPHFTRLERNASTRGFDECDERRCVSYSHGFKWRVRKRGLGDSAVLRASTAPYTGRFHLRWRVYKSANADGASATELTSSTQVTPMTTVSLSNIVSQTHSVTWSPGTTITLSNEYLFFQLGFEVATAGGGNTQDVIIRKAPASAVTSPAFTRHPLAEPRRSRQ